MKRYFFCILLLLQTAFFSTLLAQIPIAVGGSYSQDFDAIGTSATATLPSGWKTDKSTTVRTLGSFSSALSETERLGGNNLATTATNGIYNFGAGPASSATDRAIGFLSSGTATSSGNLYACFENTGPVIITSTDLSYNIEKYRHGSNPAGYGIQLYYSYDGSSWTSAGASFATNFSSDPDNTGFDPSPGDSVLVSGTLELSIPPGGYFYLAWNYSVTTGSTTTNAQALAIDNFEIGNMQTNLDPALNFFRSAGSGNWTDTVTWEMSGDGNNWDPATVVPDTNAQTITIQNGHIVEISSSLFADQIIIEEGATLSYSAGTLTLNDGPGVDLIVEGTFIDNSGSSWTSSSTWKLGNNGTLIRISSSATSSWINRYDGGIQSIPSTATWVFRNVSGSNPPIVSTNVSYPNLIFENTSGTTWSPTFTGSSGTATIKGNLDIGGNGSGAVQFSNNNSAASLTTVDGNLIIRNGSILNVNGTGFRISGNLEVNGTVNYGSSNARKLAFSGTQNQFISGSGTLNIFELIIDKSSGSLSLTRSVTIDNLLDLQEGIIETTPSDLLILNTNASVNGAGNQSYVSGPVQKNGETDFTFPVGKNGNYRPAGIFSLTSYGEFQAEYFEKDPDNTYDVEEKDTTISHISRCEYWLLEKISGTAEGKVSLNWSSNSCGVTDPAKLTVAKWDGTKWIDLGNGNTSGTTTEGIISSDHSISTFSPFALASTSGSENPLPVNLVSFSGSYTAQKVELKWSTASEKNNDYFIIERAAEGMEFEDIGRTKGNGTSFIQKKYSFTDPYPLFPINYYRLKQVDFDGNFELSRTIAVRIIQEENLKARIYASGKNIHLYFFSARKNIQVEIINFSGNKIYSQTYPSRQMEEKLIIPIYTPGIYIVCIYDDRERVMEKVVVE